MSLPPRWRHRRHPTLTGQRERRPFVRVMLSQTTSYPVSVWSGPRRSNGCRLHLPEDMICSHFPVDHMVRFGHDAAMSRFGRNCLLSRQREKSSFPSGGGCPCGGKGWRVLPRQRKPKQWRVHPVGCLRTRGHSFRRRIGRATYRGHRGAPYGIARIVYE